ncbi:hypothetical protein OPT61_g600 [Boeremia exigua]|uniref:Uncharacterized protein n=1 Tax=Boeremia exigua TaxID=749465 RepID=A0ACC2ITK9_9PLEO|nr:hypothetical protein OPT61_g600 [Boeremia exigua]
MDSAEALPSNSQTKRRRKCGSKSRNGSSATKPSRHVATATRSEAYVLGTNKGCDGAPKRATAITTELSPSTESAPICLAAAESLSVTDDSWFPNHALEDLGCDASISFAPSELTPATGDDQTHNAQSTLTPNNSTLDPVASLTHIPTTLIEYWFGRICPSRSTFDSGINYNRQVAWSTWSSSEAVFSTMQAMSAACLVSSMPQLKQILPLLRSQALDAINLSLTRVQESSLPAVTIDLVFAMLSLGTSSHWFASTSLSGSELSWSDSARDLLLQWKPSLEARDPLLHSYFSQALTHWDMLLAPVGRGSNPGRIRTKRRHLRNRLVNALSLSFDNDDEIRGNHLLAENGPDVLGTRPNSWCGISSEVISMYGQVLALCRSVSICSTDSHPSATEKATDLLCNMSIARDLHRELLTVDFDVLTLLEEAQGYPVVTQDHRTPISHLLQTAEAFRKAALLQLHLVFEDLPIVPVPRAYEYGAGAIDHQSRDAYVRSLAFDIATTLETIPIESGSRSIHPMLYLAVTVGLCNTTPSASQAASQSAHRLEESIGIYNTHPLPERASDPIQSSQSALHGGYQTLIDSPPHNLESAISNARNMILTRLGQLQQMLPHASSGQVLQVIEALWSAYDSPQINNSDICWFKVARDIASDALLWS